MVNGLPGTGIGGFFYLILAAWMPVRESARALRGHSRTAHWRFIALQWSLIGAVLLGLWGQAYLLRALLTSAPMVQVASVIDPTGMLSKPPIDLAHAAAMAATWSLVGVVISVQVLRVIMSIRAVRSQG
jgi:hypothetical protein